MSTARDVMELESLLPHLRNSRKTFAESLISNWRAKRKLSPKQVDWVGILATEAKIQREQQGLTPAGHVVPEKPASMIAAEAQRLERDRLRDLDTVNLGVDLSGLQKLFALARENGKANPKIKLALANGSAFEIYAAKSQSKNPGAIYVNVAEQYYGKITPEGKFVPYADRRLDKESLDMICEVVENPTQAGRIYGRKLKWCIFCGTQLDTNESQYYGYGPICAEKWGLEWGSAKERKAEDRQATLEKVVDDVFAEALKTFPGMTNANQVQSPTDQLGLDFTGVHTGDKPPRL